jgi:hypothetical protein
VTRSAGRLAAVALLALGAARPAPALFDPAQEYTESPAVAARFPDPQTPLATPGFKSARVGFTSQTDLLKFVDDLAKSAPGMRRRIAGHSIEQRPIPLLVFAQPPALSGAEVAANGKPTVLVVGGQHGNEPAGTEAALALALELAGPRRAALERINVLIVPRAHPDGTFHWRRRLENDADLDRDHMLQATPEGRALGRILAEYRPAVVVDSREYGVKSRWLEKFGALPRPDVMVGFAAVPNLPPGLADAPGRLFGPPVAQALGAAGFTQSTHFATSSDAGDLAVADGSTAPDTLRNVAALHNAIGIAIEARGAGIALDHYRRRVASLLVATGAILDAAARNAAEIAALVRRARDEVATSAGRGEVAVAADGTRGRQALVMLDPDTGADKSVDVDWIAATQARPTKTRPRPAGYLLPASQATAAARLAGLGVTVLRLERDGTESVERYRIVGAAVARKGDARTDDDAPAVRPVQLEVAIERAEVPVKAGDLYVPLDQPLGNLIVAALEPDAPGSYAANYALAYPGPRDKERLVPAYRVTAPLRTPTGPWAGL